MTGESSQAGTHSFVIRVWLEARDLAGPAAWRWHVKHVQGAEESYFSEVADVLTFISAVSGRQVVFPPDQGAR